MLNCIWGNQYSILWLWCYLPVKRYNSRHNLFVLKKSRRGRLLIITTRKIHGTENLQKAGRQNIWYWCSYRINRSLFQHRYFSDVWVLMGLTCKTFFEGYLHGFQYSWFPIFVVPEFFVGEFSWVDFRRSNFVDQSLWVSKKSRTPRLRKELLVLT